jgi:hypothetical protein
MTLLQLIRLCSLALPLAAIASMAQAEVVKVRYPQGSAHGFVEVTTTDGARIAVGDLLQKVVNGMVTSRLTLNFLDGSLDDETTVFSQKQVFRLISDHHVQRGPSFPKPMESMVDAVKGMVSFTDAEGAVKSTHVDLPPDTYNGLVSKVLLNISPSTPETTMSNVVPSANARIVHLSVKNAGEVPFTLGAVRRQAVDYVVHVELGGVVGVVAPVIGKQPPDYHLWVLSGEFPAFIREEGPLYEGGPIWRIQQISPAFASEPHR